MSSPTIADLILYLISRSTNSEFAGRTLLQKKLYFLSCLLGLDYGYGPHYYGPYSREVAQFLSGLVADGFLKEVSEDMGIKSDPFERAKRFTYRCDSGIHGILEQYIPEETRNKIDGNLERVNQDPTISESPKLLSMAAKVHYIVSNEKVDSLQDIINIARELGWEVELEDVERVAKYVDSMLPAA